MNTLYSIKTWIDRHPDNKRVIILLAILLQYQGITALEARSKFHTEGGGNKNVFSRVLKRAHHDLELVAFMKDGKFSHLYLDIKGLFLLNYYVPLSTLPRLAEESEYLTPRFRFTHSLKDRRRKKIH